MIMQIENLKQKIDDMKVLKVSYLIDREKPFTLFDKGIINESGEPIQKIDKSEMRL